MQAKILCKLCKAAAEVMNGLDHDGTVLSPYEEVNVEFFYTIEEKHALSILALAVNDMSSEETVLRQSAYQLLLSFVEFSGKILNGSLESNQMWSRASIRKMINNFLLKHMGNAMNKEGTRKKVLMFILLTFLLLIYSSPQVVPPFHFRILSCQLHV